MDARGRCLSVADRRVGAPRGRGEDRVRVIFKLFVCRCEARSGPRRATAHLVVGQVPERRARLQGCAGKGTDVSASALERSGVRGTQSAHAPFEPRGIRTFCFRCGRVLSRFLKPQRTWSHRALRASRVRLAPVPSRGSCVRSVRSAVGRNRGRRVACERARLCARLAPPRANLIGKFVGKNKGAKVRLAPGGNQKLRVEILKCDGLLRG